MSPVNGSKHDVEDILASIRTSIADRSPLVSSKSEHRLHAVRMPTDIADELPDFELPAIFKPASQGAAEKPNLLGRLSEALASGDASDRASRTVIRFEPAQGRMSEQVPAAQGAAKSTERSALEKAASDAEPVARVMPSFFDTRINRLGEMTKIAAQPPSAAPPVRQAQLSQQPPQLPTGAMPADAGAMEDAAAQLLRPILKQWLTENMPKIVEKALRSEADDERGGGGSSRR